MTATVLVSIDQPRGVDEILLAEALAGLAHQEQMQEICVEEETTLTHLSMKYQTWLTSPSSNIEKILFERSSKEPTSGMDR